MFDIKSEVPSMELCKRLKELGFPQNGGGWYWIKLSHTSSSENYSLYFQNALLLSLIHI